ncbi:hypothetical protein GC088_09940 [Arthrobacter sp. JZ12]|uniref:hypothetical protein n=1 Tax=Arthrobacter sp. JZ12 TaxID=2654190 RepID=UPI002B4609F9|nr:hypothetical protein [Arthrobacter sp. JZ12]WRH25350.1 hypothetical protein GC088_09940 [Arthrobacter sp. JZ12]
MDWFLEWLQSPGFGGAAALLAAVIAYAASRRSASVQRKNALDDRIQREQAERKAQWWSRAQWALNLTLSEDSETRAIGFRVLEALGESEWADEHEGDVIAAATERALDAGLLEGDEDEPRQPPGSGE